jgi:hypothetical protein
MEAVGGESSGDWLGDPNSSAVARAVAGEGQATRIDACDAMRSMGIGIGIGIGKSCSCSCSWILAGDLETWRHKRWN